MNFDLLKTKAYFPADQFFITNHARVRMFQRNITTDIVKEVVQNGEIIEEYPDDKPCPSALILGYWDNNPLHIVIAECEDHARIITVYHPEKEKWVDYKKRKEIK